MVQRIEINLKVEDGRAKTAIKNINKEYENIVEKITISDIYTLESDITEEEFKKIKNLITNPLIENISLNTPLHKTSFDFALEIGFLPGVTDNVGNTAKQVINDALKKEITVYSSKLFYIKTKNKVKEETIQQIGEFLSNKLIQRNHIKSIEKFTKDQGMDKIIPKVNLKDNTTPITIDLISATNEQLIEIGKKGILDPTTNERRGPLALDLPSMQVIQKYFKENQKRNPTDIELESLAQTWSEHCKHTIFAAKIDDIEKGLFKSFIKKATNDIRDKLKEDDFCVSVFTDNSGVIKFDENYSITDKAETHNSPSALDPFGGAITGIVGVNRDTIGVGMGALPIINGYGFCVADPRTKPELFRSKNKTNPALSPRKIMDGIIAGVNEGGNCSGIPTAQGFMNFHENFSGKPLVFVRTVGLIPKEVNGKDATQKEAQPGDLIVVIGGRVGKDGIHGATFSSEAIDSGSPATAVQIGDPITQKKFSDALIKEARDLGLYNSITDNGAGGISCSVAEMAKECGGCDVDLEKVPLKYPGMSPWEIWISESQERMTLSLPKKNWETFNTLMKQRGVEAKIIGTFTNSGSCVVKYEGKEIMNIELEFLHEGLPNKELKTTYTKKTFEEPNTKDISIKESILEMIAKLNICSIEFVNRQYDHEVGAGSVLKPITGKGEIISEASIVRPVLTSKKAIGLSQSLLPRYGDIDTYDMATCAIDASIKNIICAGIPYGKIALMDNFCWCSSNEPERLGQLKRAVQGCYDGALAYLAPYISGKDSMFNDFKGFDKNDNPIKISAPPTLLISSIGVMDDYNKSVSPEPKCEGDLIYIIGTTKKELGGSEFFVHLGEKEKGKSYTGNNVPKVDFKTNEQIYKTVTKAIQKDMITSAMPVNSGGIGIAIAKMAIGSQLGIQINLSQIPINQESEKTKENTNMLNDIEKLFSESAGRIIVTINSNQKNQFEELFKEINSKCIGEVKGDTLKIKGEKELVSIDIKSLETEYKKTLEDY